MYAVKETSTNNLNRQSAVTSCPVTYTLDKIGGRWKALIIYNLLQGPQRYGALKKAMPAITEKMLIQQLKELEADLLVTREVKPVVPPHVTYSLTERGLALSGVLQAMAAWGLTYNASEINLHCQFDGAAE
ncbi:MAG: transcriptional regulator [Chitinophagia bacterium]|nr:transcriptional regulator [Chitinophagia bacterium]